MGGMKIEGKDFKINGKICTLYPISKLAQHFVDEGLPRDPQTLRKWIRDGVMPKPMFYNPKTEEHPKGLWTMEQIKLIVQTAKDCGVRNGYKMSSTDFEEVLRSRWKKLNDELFKKEIDK